MYNMLFGENELADDLLKMLNLTKEDCGRYRDCYLDEKGEKIIVYTRNGGGNREYYEEVFDKLSSHTNYLCDYDDDFDCTYASIEFSNYHSNDENVWYYSESQIFYEKGIELFNEIYDTFFQKYNDKFNK